MRFDVIAKILEVEQVGLVGRSIFINFIPDDKAGILLRHPFGGMPLTPELPGYLRGSFMLISRVKGYTESEKVHNLAVQALRRYSTATIDGVTFRYMRPRALPFPYSPSPAQNNEFHTTMDCLYIDTTQTAA